MASPEAFAAFLKDLQDRKQAGPPIEVCMHEFSWMKDAKKAEPEYILHNISTTFRPGTMTLILGPPGCGKTALLKSIAGVFHYRGAKKDPRITGRVTYNGQPPRALPMENVVAFVSQKDEHIPTLTVAETIAFSHDCRSAEGEDGAVTANAIIDGLGLRGCAQTLVGNDLIRGISGGQKRRVTIAEMLTGKESIVLLDEYSTGLDTTVTLDLTRKLRDMCTTLQYTFVCSLLQPPPEVYALFDNVILLNSGEVAYVGSRVDCAPYFLSVGYAPPPRVDEADFLQEVTTDLGQSYVVRGEDGKTPRLASMPATPSAFSEAFKASKYFAARHGSGEPSTGTVARKPRHSVWRKFVMVFGRQFKLVKRDTRFNRVRVGQNTGFGLIIGSLFWQLGFGASTVPSKVGLVFLTILFTSVTTISNIAYTVEVRNIFHKQAYFGFYPPLAYAFSESVIEVVCALVQVFLFTITSYWMCGFANPSGSGQEYGVYYVAVVLNSCCMCQLFKAVASVAKSPTAGVSAASGLIFLEIVFSGFAILHDVMPKGLAWIYWINPGSWTFRALLLNEYTAPEPAYDVTQPTFHMRLGDYYLSMYGIVNDRDYIQGGVLYLIGFYIAAVLLATAGYTFVRPKVVHARQKRHKLEYHFHQKSHGELRASVRELMDKHPVDFTPTSLCFRDLFYTVQIAHKKKDGKGAVSDTVQLLQGIHGHCRPYTLTALMGSSGAGKSTLLDVLAGRKNTGVIKGNLYVNGQPLTKLDQKRFGYVEQTDIHCMKTSVEEAFRFSAQLRLPPSAQANASNIVVSTLHLLELVAEAKKPLTELSCEQMKRLTIGVELVANPSVLFLDEPTSGLDVHAAHIVMVAVKRIAAAGRTVICTIHQPSLSLFELFDDLILLQTGGRTVFCGPIGPESVHLLSHFESIANVRKCGPKENPATYMLDALAGNSAIDFHDLYTKSPMQARNLKAIEATVTDVQQGLVSKSSEVRSATFAHQFHLLLVRTGRKYWRTKDYTIGRLGVGVLIAILLGILCSVPELEYSTQVQSQLGICFIYPMFMGIISINTGLAVVDAERMVYFRETSSGMYATTPYSIVFGLVEIPLVMFNSVVHVVIFYYAVGLNTANAEAFPWFLLFFFLYNLYATYLGQWLVATLPDLRTATVVSGALSSIFSIFSGFFIHYENIPMGWRFLYWISPLHYVLEGVFTTQFLLNSNTVLLGSPSHVLSPTPVQVNTFVQNMFGSGIQYDNRGYDALALVAWVLVLRVGNVLSQKYMSSVSR
ncbi:ATP-binding Cassette (ABC) Superfamily [Achlya hypogyna]|uniref:ATP-binding Cassette (ABC) Superfamily n=1 Tax=Achlya hypogyna TaxID=1202772 RepID=A0A1V9ZR90_ACHHY|nr:ATP-binding Cassette (ABC) Superfamily [Achlya hypogyna]